MKKLFAALFLSSLAAGCAIEGEVDDEGDEESSDGLAGDAVLDSGDLATVGILWKDAAGIGKICTGELIAPKVVLTAGHCVIDAKSGTVFVGKSSAAADQIEKANVAKFLPHPNYKPKTGPFNDIGAIILATPLTKATPLAVNRQPLEKIAKVGTQVKMVGYGVTDRQKGDAGKKRLGYAKITQIARNEFAVAGTATACGGDSGGPAFVRTAAGWLLVGTESRGDTACVKGTVKERVDAFLPFIDGALAQGK